MPKDFAGWSAQKQTRDTRPPGPPFFHEREVWWSAIGVNIGFEEDGKGSGFSRPVLIVRKFGGGLFYGVPLSTTGKRGPFYYPFTYKIERGESVALLTQMRALDARRLIRKDGMADEADFTGIIKALTDLIAGK